MGRFFFDMADQNIEETWSKQLLVFIDPFFFPTYFEVTFGRKMLLYCGALRNSWENSVWSNIQN